MTENQPNCSTPARAAVHRSAKSSNSRTRAPNAITAAVVASDSPRVASRTQRRPAAAAEAATAIPALPVLATATVSAPYLAGPAHRDAGQAVLERPGRVGPLVLQQHSTRHARGPGRPAACRAHPDSPAPPPAEGVPPTATTPLLPPDPDPAARGQDRPGALAPSGQPPRPLRTRAPQHPVVELSERRTAQTARPPDRQATLTNHEQLIAPERRATCCAVRPLWST